MNSRTPSAADEWLLLGYQMPAKPAYRRTKIWRRLQALGAVAIKNAVHALPSRDNTTEQFQTLAADIAKSGGEAVVTRSRLVAGLTDTGLRAVFDSARNSDYESLADEVRARLKSGKMSRAVVRKLQRRRTEIAAIDFFGAHARQTLDELLQQAERRLNRHVDVSRDASSDDVSRFGVLKNRVWVTRRDVHVDRIASAWVIQRFIDPQARFKFVKRKNYTAKSNELRFDMAGAEFTHADGRCTFETLVRTANLLGDNALTAIAEIVHELDIEDGKYARSETAGFSATINGICATAKSDDERLQLGMASLDQFYAFFALRPQKST